LLSKSNGLIVVVAGHRPNHLKLPLPYQIMRLGSEGQELVKGEISDASMYNISDKNEIYAELTALFWIWKNTSSNIKGLVHYRRFFLAGDCRGVTYPLSPSNLSNSVLSHRQITQLLDSNDILIPEPTNLKLYGYENGLQHYQKNHNNEILIKVDSILIKNGYSKSLSQYLSENNLLSFYNMLIGRKSCFDSYCEFLFPILKELELELNTENTQSRWVGFLAERLFNYWLDLISDIPKGRIKIMPIGILIANPLVRFLLQVDLNLGKNLVRKSIPVAFKKKLRIFVK